MLIEKNGFVIIHDTKGNTSLYDSAGRCLLRRKDESLSEEDAYKLIEIANNVGLDRFV